jgi:hypothetical protein
MAARKTYVRVAQETDENGLITPTSLVFQGVKMDIDRVLDRRQAHATKTGGQGMRYTVRIGRHETYLFQDDAQRWFVEEMDHVREVPHCDGG